MKSIFKILPFFYILLSPTIVLASGCGNYTIYSTCNEHLDYCIWDNNECTERCPTTDNSCQNWHGCYLQSSAGDGMSSSSICTPCNQGEYNNTANATTCSSCATCNDPSDDTNFDNCTAWQWTGIDNSPVGGAPANSIFDAANATYGQSSCPWICDSGYYRGGANNNECIQCPTHSTGCTTSGQTYQTVQCDTGYRKVLDHDAHTVECSKCADNATLVDNNCKCNTNYYGDGNTQCTRCPAGTTTTSNGATNVSQCRMSSNTKFCDTKGNCMKLIPSNATSIN